MRNALLNGIAPIALCAPEGVASGITTVTPKAAPASAPAHTSGTSPSKPAPKARAAKRRAPQFAASLELGDRYIREEECFRLSGLSRTTRWRLERKGQFPKRRQLSDNAIGWLLSEVLAWRGSRPPALTVSEAA